MRISKVKKRRFVPSFVNAEPTVFLHFLLRYGIIITKKYSDQKSTFSNCSDLSAQMLAKSEKCSAYGAQIQQNQQKKRKLLSWKCTALASTQRSAQLTLFRCTKFEKKQTKARRGCHRSKQILRLKNKFWTPCWRQFLDNK